MLLLKNTIIFIDKLFFRSIAYDPQIASSLRRLIDVVQNGASFHGSGLRAIQNLIDALINLGYHLDRSDHPPYIVREAEQALQEISGYI